MAASRIKGITVEIGGDTTGLSKALSGINGEIRNTQSQLKDVDRLLKLDPENTEALEQKQRLLNDAIDKTKTKLDILKTAEKQVQEQFKKGEVSQEQYDGLKREIELAKISLNKYEKELDQVTSTTKTSDSQTKGLENKIDDLGDSAKDTTKQLEEMNDTLKSEVYMETADKLGEISDKLIELGGSAMDAFNETKSATSKATAYFGETGEAAEKTAKLIEDVYSDGVGDSMDSVSNAVIMVKKNIKDLDDVTLKNITEQAITLDELYGIDMNETLRGVNSLMQNFGMDAQTAMDFIVKGSQKGLDKTNELGDNLAEYSGKFEQAGYSADEYFQLLNNGLDGGAYNLDKVNDAINEVTTRLADGTIEDSMSSINEKTGELEKGTGNWSEETENLFKSWQNGEATQKQVIDSIVSDIKKTSNEQDKLNMAALAFGTMGEDGSMQFIESLTSVGSAYEDVGGSAQEMFEQTSTPAQEMESNIRKVQEVLVPLGEKLMELANQILPPIVEGIKWFADLFLSLPEPIQNFTLIFGGLLVILGTVAPIIIAITTAVTALNIPLLPIIGIVAAIAAGIAIVIAVFKNWGAICDWFGEIFGKLGDFLGSVWETIRDAFEKFGSFLGDVFSGIWEGAVNTFTSVFNGFKTFITETWNKITGVFNKFNDFLNNIFSTDWTEKLGALGEPLNALFKNISSIWESIKKIFSGIVDFVKGIFTGNWKQAWEGVKKIFSGVFDGLIAIAKAPLNAIIGLLNGAVGALNGLIGGLNKINFDVPNWVPVIGGKKFGFNIPKIPKIPYLAKGGKLSEGTAVVGEAGPELLSMINGNAVVQPLTNSTANTTNTNLGGINITIYGAPGQSESALAEIVAERLQHNVNAKGAVYG